MAEQKGVEGVPKQKKVSTHRGEDCPLQGLGRCTKGNCAWWNHLDEECSILTLATLATIEIGGSGRKRD